MGNQSRKRASNVAYAPAQDWYRLRMDDNLEARARALCAADIAFAEPRPRQRAAAVERYWRVVAMEITGNLAVPGIQMSAAGLQLLQEEYRQLRHR